MPYIGSVAPISGRDHTNGCDENRTYREKCGDVHRSRTQQLREWRGQRGLYIEYEGISSVGLGHALANIFLLHDICVQVERFCYIKLLDMDLHELMGYAADGLSWGPPALDEIARYSATRAIHVSSDQLLCGLNSTGDCSHNILGGRWLADTRRTVQALSRLPFASASLIHLKTSRRLRFDGSNFLPVWPHEHAKKRAHPRLTTCHCRFVTEPWSFLRPSHAAATTYQIRTGLADVDTKTLKRLQRWLTRGRNMLLRSHEMSTTRRVQGATRSCALMMGRECVSQPYAEMNRWLDLACPHRQWRWLKMAQILTDSPPLSRLVTSHPEYAATANSASVWQRLAVDLNDTTRSWDTSIAIKQQVWKDMVAGSMSRALFVSSSSFNRPMIRRSVCVEEVHNITHPESLCPYLDEIFSRDFFGLDVNFKSERFGQTQRRLVDFHPCKSIQVAKECAVLYLASITGIPVEFVNRTLFAFRVGTAVRGAISG